MTQEEKYLQWMEEFFCQEDGETCKEYVIETSKPVYSVIVYW